MKKTIVVTLLVLGLLGTISLAACGSTETRLNNFSVGARPVVEVTVGNGNVSFVVAQDGEIIVTAELRKPNSVEYDVSQDGDLIVVNAKTRSSSKADVTVTMPENTEFKVSIGNGSIDAADVKASGEAHTGNGNIILKDAMGSFMLTDGNGSISLEGINGDVSVNIGNGDITLTDATGSFNLINGNGNIRFQGELDAGSNNSFIVGNGSVTVELTGSPSVALDLETEQDGKVRCDLPVTISEQSGYRLVGAIGNGEALLEVRIGSGNIVIK